LGLICTGCGQGYSRDLEAPAAWATKHPDLKGLCPACVFAKLNEIMMEEG
jgi:predicted GNAT family acetyltransferase